MTMITNNHDLLREIADLIERNEIVHDQSVWAAEVDDDDPAVNACGTRACIAGWACILGTDDFFVRGGKYIPRIDAVRRWLRKGRGLDQGSVDYYVDLGKKDLTERTYALDSYSYFLKKGAELLGLEDGDALDRTGMWALFDGEMGPINGHTTVTALRAIADGDEIESVWGRHDTEPSA